MTETARLIQDIEHARTALLAEVDGLSEAEAATRPVEGQWSVVENLEHLYLAEFAGIAKIGAGLEACRSGKGWTDARPNQGKSIEDIVTATWKPKEAAPPIATPHIGGPIEFWRTATRSLTQVLAGLGAQIGDTSLEDIVFPHFLSGPLDGRQLLEFLRFHIQRHISQIGHTKRKIRG